MKKFKLTIEEDREDQTYSIRITYPCGDYIETPIQSVHYDYTPFGYVAMSCEQMRHLQHIIGIALRKDPVE